MINHDTWVKKANSISDTDPLKFDGIFHIDSPLVIKINESRATKTKTKTINVKNRDQSNTFTKGCVRDA